MIRFLVATAAVLGLVLSVISDNAGLTVLGIALLAIVAGLVLAHPDILEE